MESFFGRINFYDQVETKPKVLFFGRLDGVDLKNSSHESYVAQLYEKHGASCVETLSGEFVLAIWDPRKRQYFCARDHVGTHPLYFTNTKNFFAFSSEIKLLLALEGVDKTPNERWIVEYLTHSNIDREDTYYAGISRLRGAHRLIASEAGVKIERYWSIKNAPEIRLTSDDDYVEAFKEKLWTAVGDRLKGNKIIASELSGGLDSTSIAAVANEILGCEGRKLHAFSHVLPKERSKSYQIKDERDEIDNFIRLSKITQHQYLSSEHLSAKRAIDRAVYLQSMPTMETFTMFSDELNDKVSQAGCGTLLSGFGGDELVTGHAPSWRQEYANRFMWGKLWSELRAYPNIRTHRALKMMLKLALAAHCSPMYKALGGSYETTLNGVRGNIANTFVNESSARKYGISGLMQDKKAYSTFETVRAQQEADFENNRHMALRLESSVIHARFKLLNISFPLLDKRLVEFCIGLPIEQKRRHGFGRYLMRRAMKGYIPEDLRWRQNKGGAAVPGAKWRQIKEFNSFSFSNLKSLSSVNYKKLMAEKDIFLDLEERAGVKKLSVLYAYILGQFLQHKQGSTVW